MSDRSKTQDQLLEELEALRAEVALLKQQSIAANGCSPSYCIPPHYQEHLLAGFFSGATQSSVGLFILDTNLRYLQANQALAEINGASLEEHLGRFYYEVIPELAPTLAPLLQTLIKTGKPVSNFEISGYTKRFPGVLRHWIASYFPIKNAVDEVIAVGGTVLDITEYKQTITALRQSKVNLQTAQRIAHVGSWYWDRTTKTVFWSEEMYNIHGVDPHQPAPEGADLERLIYPDDLHLHQSLIERAIAGYSFEVDLRIIRPDGEVRYIEARAEPGVFNDQGELVRLFGTVLDVTERKRVEEALRQSEFALREAQRLAHVGSWKWSPDTGVVWSEELYRIHGFSPDTSPAELDKRVDYIHPEDLEIRKAILAASLVGQPYEYDLRIIRPDGDTRYIEARGEPGIRNDNGDIVGLFGTVLDVTDRKQVEQQLRQSEANLARAQKIAHIGSWEYNLVTQTCTWSEELYHIHQLESDQPAPVGEAMNRLIHPDDLWIDQELVKAPLMAGKPCEADLRIIRQDGEVRNIEVRGEPLFNSLGELTGWVGTVMDITERKRVEAQLRQIQTNLAKAQELAHIGSWEYDVVNQTCTWSDEMYRIHQIDPSQPILPSDAFYQLIHPDDQEAALSACMTGRPWELDLRILRTDGEVRNAEVRAEPILDSSGEITKWVGTVMDITDRKRVEEKLRQSQDNLARAQQLAHIGSWEHDLTNQTTTWSEELYRIHQLDPSQPPPTGDESVRYVHPDDRPILLNGASVPQPQVMDLRIIRQDGEIRNIEVRSDPVFDEQGQMVKWLGTVMDITDRKRIEEKLRRSEAEMRAILDAIPDMLIRVKKDGTRLFISPGSLRSYQPVASLTGSSIYDTLPADMANQRMFYVERAIATGEKQVYEYEILVDGELHYEEARIVAINNEEALIVVRDITERHRLEQMKTEFISVVSHELRTPLTSIQVALSLLDEQLVEPASEDAQTMIHTATQGVDRLVRLVNDILDLERLQSGRVRIARQACCPARLVETAIEQMKELANKSNVQFEVSVEDCTVYADPDRLTQVLTNLLSNAIRFSPADSVVAIAVHPSSESSSGSSVLKFMVKDEGRGIPIENLESIFERFQQVDASDSRERGGTGLGLAICRSIIQEHGGQIWAESEFGQGSTFYFTLPLRSEQ